MPAKVTTWNKSTVRHVLLVVEKDSVVKIEVGYNMEDAADATVVRHESEVLLPPAPASLLRTRWWRGSSAM